MNKPTKREMRQLENDLWAIQVNLNNVALRLQRCLNSIGLELRDAPTLKDVQTQHEKAKLLFFSYLSVR